VEEAEIAMNKLVILTALAFTAGPEVAMTAHPTSAVACSGSDC
jgi:hypothetical protein